MKKSFRDLTGGRRGCPPETALPLSHAVQNLSLGRDTEDFFSPYETRRDQGVSEHTPVFSPNAFPPLSDIVCPVSRNKRVMGFRLGNSHY
jgi:hypothetical protein